MQEAQQLYVIEENGSFSSTNTKTALVETDQIPSSSFSSNWLTVAAALDCMGLDPQNLASRMTGFNLPPHRCNLVATYNGVRFYNDSKATVVDATRAAIAAFGRHEKIVLMLGGLSKGVDRSLFIQELGPTIQRVVCFGSESTQLEKACIEAALLASSSPSLEEAFETACSMAEPGMLVLFSPAGASFDLFKNYEERGECFERLVRKKLAEQGAVS
jgi:UDP-N-acetylmuramoylalanine--D-glutamate ligase